MKILKTLISVFAPLGFILTVNVILSKFGISSIEYTDKILRWIGYSVISIIIYKSIE